MNKKKKKKTKKKDFRRVNRDASTAVVHSGKVGLTKEEIEAIDNKVVLATAIALTGAIVIAFLYRWLMAYPTGTRYVVLGLMYAGLATIATFITLAIVKKDKSFYPYAFYGLGLAFIMYMIAYSPLARFSSAWGVLSYSSINYWIAYGILTIYLIASYIYYGMKRKK